MNFLWTFLWTFLCEPFFELFVQVMTMDGTVVGKVTKQWSGVAREAFTDADNFGVNFPMDLDVRIKTVLLAAVFLIVSVLFAQYFQTENFHFFPKFHKKKSFEKLFCRIWIFSKKMTMKMCVVNCFRLSCVCTHYRFYFWLPFWWSPFAHFYTTGVTTMMTSLGAILNPIFEQKKLYKIFVVNIGWISDM